ncbi:hypothetical protein FACS1894208_11010 [Clostridia bacterium]|nr:hypothetical protein FACS1894208_11010 [Clostridia bacterium]
MTLLSVSFTEDFLATPTPSASSGSLFDGAVGGYGIWQTVLGVVLFLALLAAAVFVLRWFSRRTYGPMTAKNIQVLERAVIGRDAVLLLVRVGARTMLLSSTKDGVSLLREMSDLDGEQQPPPPPPAPQLVPQKIELPETPPEIAPKEAAVSGLSFVDSYDQAISAIKDRGGAPETEDKPVTVALRSAAASYAGAARPKPAAKPEPATEIEEIPLVKLPKKEPVYTKKEPAPPSSGDEKMDELLEKVRQRNAKYNKRK